MTEATIRLPPKLVPLFGPPRGSYQYRAMHGGRGSAKSYTAALMASVWGYAEPLRILCAREYQNSIAESFHAELKAAIDAHDWLSAHYEVGERFIKGRNGTEFIFRGLRHSVQSIKSLAKIDLTIVEEAEDVPEASWLSLEATVFRQPKSELWAIWNPRTEGSPVDQRFRKAPPPRSRVVEINWSDNPYFPPGLDELRRREQERLDPNTYTHVWDGAYLTNSDAQVFAGKWRISEFEPEAHWSGPYQGGDFGFAQDPTAAVRCYIHDDTLYVSHEAVKRQLELDHTADFIARRIPDFGSHVTRWDSARPESISYLKRHGLPRSEAVEKWKGSVEDGVSFIRSLKGIVVHPRCTVTQQELRLYSHKVDRLSGDVLPDIEDANNHCLVAGTLVDTQRGRLPIEKVLAGDYALTRAGYRLVTFSGVTDVDRDVVNVETTLGSFICTPDHKVYTCRGFVRADALRYDDEIIGSDISWSKHKSLAARFSVATLMLRDRLTALISAGQSRAERSCYIGKSGDIITAISRMAGTSITRMETRPTTTYRTLRLYRSESISEAMGLMLGAMSARLAKLSTWSVSAISPRLGIQASRGERFIGGLVGWPTRRISLNLRIASIADRCSSPGSKGTAISSAPTPASPHIAGIAASMMSSGLAIADRRSRSTATARPDHVRGRVLKVSGAGVADKVYDLTVEGEHEFFANGVLVSNCLDALRYALSPLTKRRGAVKVSPLVW